MAVVFNYVWPERAAAWRSLDAATRSSELQSFEPEALTEAGATAEARLRRLIDLTRRALLAQAALTEAGAALLGRAIGRALESVARQVETGVATEPVDLRAQLAEIAVNRASAAGVASAFDREIALCEVWVERVEALQRATETRA